MITMSIRRDERYDRIKMESTSDSVAFISAGWDWNICSQHKLYATRNKAIGSARTGKTYVGMYIY